MSGQPARAGIAAPGPAAGIAAQNQPANALGETDDESGNPSEGLARSQDEQAEPEVKAQGTRMSSDAESESQSESTSGTSATESSDSMPSRPYGRLETTHERELRQQQERHAAFLKKKADSRIAQEQDDAIAMSHREAARHQKAVATEAQRQIDELETSA